MFIADIKRVIDQVSRDKGIDRDVLIKALEEALESAAKKKFGTKVNIEVQYNDATGEIEVFQFKDVTEEITEPDIQISLEEGRKLDSECEIGDSLGTKMDTSTFGRIAAQSAKQVIIQKMKDAERDAVYSSFIGRKGEIINGIVQRFDRNGIIVNLGQTEGILPSREQIPKESYRRGDRIRAYIMEVLHETRGPQIILSRTHPDFLTCLFKTEVPEISEGIVTIMAAVREPGVRAKFAVTSNDSDIDPVGACVGMKGSRVQNVVQELRGEKIDIISWHIDPAKFLCNALAPAEISRVIIDEENHSMEVIVPDEFLSIAIGKKGQNVRLASKLTKWHLDVISESRYSKAMQDGYNSLVSLPGVGISMADSLYEKGFYSAEELSHSSVKDLTQIRGIGEEKAMQLIETAKNYMASTNSVDELSNESSINDEADSDEILAGSDVQEVLEEETIDKTSEEFVPDDEANDHDTSVGLDVQENLKEIGNSDEHPSGHSLSANNATEND
ncbi:MAG: transcription termination/antitermination protein NusA [Deltaproteobacteria bacterium]|nr:MAG: transcription termination/antitermination protein NusA [Deltaproteobacteria bacterium]